MRVQRGTYQCSQVLSPDEALNVWKLELRPDVAKE